VAPPGRRGAPSLGRAFRTKADGRRCVGGEIAISRSAPESSCKRSRGKLHRWRRTGLLEYGTPAACNTRRRPALASELRWGPPAETRTSPGSGLLGEVRLARPPRQRRVSPRAGVSRRKDGPTRKARFTAAPWVTLAGAGPSLLFPLSSGRRANYWDHYLIDRKVSGTAGSKHVLRAAGRGEPLSVPEHCRRWGPESRWVSTAFSETLDPAKGVKIAIATSGADRATVAAASSASA